MSTHRFLVVLVTFFVFFSALSDNQVFSREIEISNAAVAKEEEIAFWEKELLTLQETELRKAVEKVNRAGAALEQAQQQGGFFKTSKVRTAIRGLEDDYQSSLERLSRVQKEEQAMLARLKPLYGIVSIYFAQDQKDQMAQSIAFVSDVTFRSAMWESIFNIGEAENFSDVIKSFIAMWLVRFVLLYPFAILYYALWSLPWSIYAYSSGWYSIFPALGAYVLSVFIMSLPLITLVGGTLLVVYLQNKGIAKRQRPHTD